MAMLGKKHDSQPKVLDVDASLQGNLSFKDAVNLHINGNFEGRLETKGDLLIGENAIVKANIIGERITIAGQVTGDISAVTEIKLSATAKVIGNIQSPSFTMEKGSVFHGQSHMLADQDREQGSARRPFLSVDEVARYLSVEKELISQWAESGKLPAAREVGNGNWRFEKSRVDEWVANGRLA